MKTFIIEDLKLKEAMDFLNGCKKKDKIQIYMYTDGGHCWEFDALTIRLNEMVDEGFNITLRAHYAASAGFNLLWNFKGKISIEPECDLCIHLVRMDLSVKGSVICSNDPTNRGRHVWYGKQAAEKYDFMTPEEQQNYEDGKDIYIDPDRTKAIFANRKK